MFVLRPKLDENMEIHLNLCMASVTGHKSLGSQWSSSMSLKTVTVAGAIASRFGINYAL